MSGDEKVILQTLPRRSNSSYGLAVDLYWTRKKFSDFLLGEELSGVQLYNMPPVSILAVVVRSLDTTPWP